MVGTKDDCPTCTEQKDKRAYQCRPCKDKYNPSLVTLPQPLNWHVHKSGYIVARGGNNLLYMHRYVIEHMMGIKLNRKEHVHHLDGDKTNNCFINLQLLTDKEHGKMHLTTDKAKIISKLGHEVRWGYYGNV